MSSKEPVTRTYQEWLYRVSRGIVYDFEHCPSEYRTYELYLTMIKEDPYTIKIIPVEFQTEELLTHAVCVALMKRDGLLLEHLWEKFRKDVEICTAAVSQNVLAFKFALIQTPGMCLHAVSHDGRNLAFVMEQTPVLCAAAIKNTLDAVVFVKEKTPEILKHMFEHVKPDDTKHTSRCVISISDCDDDDW